MTKEISDSLGREFGRGLRRTSGYEKTRAKMDALGLTEEILNKTPPVGVNLRLLSEMPAVQNLAERFQKRPISVAMLGLASLDGVDDMHRFVAHTLGSSFDTFHIVDIDPDMIESIERKKRVNGLSHIEPHLLDARHTGLDNGSIDLVIRDHTGNCCPPMIDRAIDEETARILKPNGISIVNITTSEMLGASDGRATVDLTNNRNAVGTALTDALRSRIYDLSELRREFGEDMASLRGKLLEIEPGGFAVFGEDEAGHGEWFRRLENHVAGWRALGFNIRDIKSRFGSDSHEPPLSCFRHNIVLEKNGGAHE